MKMERTHFFSNITTLLLLALALVIVILVLVTSLCLRPVTTALTTSTMQSHSYEHLLRDFISEQANLDAYQLKPDSTIIMHQLMINADIIQETEYLIHDGDPVDEALGAQITAQQASYIFYSGRFFTALDTKAFTQAQLLRAKQLDPIAHQSEQDLSARIPQVTRNVRQALDELEAVQHRFFVLGLSALIISIVLIASTLEILRNYRRTIEAAGHTEMVRLQQIAFSDPLTSLGNHFAYQEQLATQIKETSEDGDELVLALLDLDEFRQFNDEYGHKCGDDVLVSVSALLQEAKLSDKLFRLGADDFAVLMPHTSLSDAKVALERLREDVLRRLGTSVSIGIAHTITPTISVELLRAQATAALEEAKRRGRNRVVAFAGIADDVSIVSFDKARAARQILNDRKMGVAFQPIWDLATKRVLAFEALSRPDTSSGLSGPQELFDIIERIGRAHELDVVCVEAILARANELPPDALLFLNLSPQSLVHELLTGATLLSAVIAAGLEPARVVLEITERSMVHMDELIEQVKRLQRLGFRIALDDAGAGNAGLEMLSRVPFDFVKIDRMVLTNALSDQAAHSVFLGLVTIARESGINVVAEGIETSEMLDFVQQVGVGYVQGYLLGRPSATVPENMTFYNPDQLLVASGT